MIRDGLVYMRGRKGRFVRVCVEAPPAWMAAGLELAMEVAFWGLW